MQLKETSMPLQAIHNNLTVKNQLRLFILRLDLIHPTIIGNKYFKLKYNLEEAKKQNKNTLLTFGGAYSNHIVAVASAGKEFGLKTVGIIRGEKHFRLNECLQYAADCGMQLHYISREEYQLKENGLFYKSKSPAFSNYYLIPEGGSNELGVLGCKEISQHIPLEFDYVCCACGTGATLAGITLSLKRNQQAIGFQILKGENYIKTEIEKWMLQFNQQKNNSWSINEEYHFGGYAKENPELISFKNEFQTTHGIFLDRIYTSKMLYGVFDLMKKGKFDSGKTIVAIHTGGNSLMKTQY